VITSYVAGGDFSAIGLKLIPAVVSLFLVISAGYMLNDVCDRTVDAINSPERAIAKGTITPKTALIHSVILFAIGTLLAGYCGGRFFAVLVLVAFGLIIYDLYSKKMGIFKNIMVAAFTVSLYPLSFALAEPVVTPRLHSLYIFPVWLFLTSVGYEMLKDIHDVNGDKLFKDNRNYCESPIFLLTARIIVMAAALLSILPYFLGYCKAIYLGSSVLTIVLAFVSLKRPPVKAIPFVYAGVFIITVGSLADLLVFGP